MKSDLTNEAQRGLGLKRVTPSIALLLVMAVLASMLLVSKPESVLAAAAVDQCNGAINAGGGTVTCSVTIVNNLTDTTTSSTVTVARQCVGSPLCAGGNIPPTTTTLTELVTAVTQCNGSGSGGGSLVTCNVTITNSITASAIGGTTPATVRQCVGSGTGGGTEPTTNCNPSGNTTGATVDQCNGSGNGGGASMRVTCTVTPGSTTTPALPVTVNQCNGSGNGGGTLVTCTVSITNIIRQTPVVETPAATSQAGAATATQVAAAAATQVTAATATQVAAATATQAAAATATQAAAASPAVTTPAQGLRPPQSGDAGLLQDARSGRPAAGIALAGVLLLGAVGLARLRPKRGQA